MYEYKMDRNLAVSLINVDNSGLNEDDLEIYNSIDFNFVVINWNEDSNDINDKCDFTGLWSHCVIIETRENK